MNKNNISLNEINLDTFIDYVDRAIIERGVLTPSTPSKFEKHVSALRNYYYNMNGKGMDYLIDIQHADDSKLGKPIILAEPLFTLKEHSGLFDPNNCKYTVKTKINITSSYELEEITDTTGITPTKEFNDLESLRTTAVANYNKNEKKLIDLLTYSMKNSQMTNVSDIVTTAYNGFTTNMSRLTIPTLAELTKCLFGASYDTGKSYTTINTGEIWKDKDTGKLYKVKTKKSIASYDPNYITNDYKNPKNVMSTLKALNTKAVYVSTYNSIRGPLLTEFDPLTNYKNSFFENLQSFYENGYTLSDTTKVSAYRSDYLDNSNLNIKGIFDTYSEETRLYQDYLATCQTTDRSSFIEFDDYEQIVLSEKPTDTSAANSFLSVSLTDDELMALYEQASSVNPYIRLKEYEQYATIDERYYGLCEEALRNKLKTASSTVDRIADRINLQNNSITKKSVYKTDFKEYMKNLLTFYFYGDETIKEYSKTKTGSDPYYTDSRESFINISRYLSSYNKYYYNKINQTGLNNTSYTESTPNLSVYVLYHDKTQTAFNNSQLKAMDAQLRNGWRIKQ